MSCCTGRRFKRWRMWIRKILTLEPYVKRQLLISSCIYLGQTLVGFGMGWTAPVIPKLMQQGQTTLPEPMTYAQASWAGSLLYIGCIIGPFITAYLSNVVGRKPCLMLGGVLTLVSLIMVVFTGNIATIFALRIIKGFGIGIIAVSNMVYIGEIASTEIRGILLTGIGIFSTLGTLVIYAVGPYVSYAGTGLVGMGITLVYMAGLYFIPETPVFQVLKGNAEETQRILHILRREHETDLVSDTKLNLEEAKKSKAEWIQLFTVKCNRKAVLILLTLGVLQQLSGVVAVIFFAGMIFDIANSSVSPNLATIIIGITQLCASCITPMFVEKAGRRILLMVSSAACAISLAVLAVYFYLDDSNVSWISSVGWIPLTTLIIFFLSYDMGFGIIPSTLTGEMFRLNVRSAGAAISTTFAWLIGFFVATGFNYALPVLGGHVVFGTFSIACALASLFTAVFVPETRGKSFAEIEEMLSR